MIATLIRLILVRYLLSSCLFISGILIFKYSLKEDIPTFGKDSKISRIYFSIVFIGVALYLFFGNY